MLYGIYDVYTIDIRMATLDHKLLPLRELDVRDIERWRALAETAIEPNPFFDPDYLMPLARSLGDFDDVALAVVADGDSWLGCMPVGRVGRWHRIPLPSTSVWRGRGPTQALLGTPLIAAARTHDAVATLLDGVVRSPGSSFTGLEALVEDGPVFAALRSALEQTGLRALRFDRVERALLTRRPECDYLEQALTAKHRRQVRGQWRKLCAQLGEEPQVVDRAGEPAAVAELIELEGRSHLAERGNVLRSDPAQARFFTEMCAAFAARGRLQLLSLQTGDRTLAMKCNLLADPGIFYLKIAYDESYAKLSPGVQLEVRMYSLFHERSQALWVDSCATPENESCNRMLPSRRALVTLAILEPTVRALATVPIIRGARHLRNRRKRLAV